MILNKFGEHATFDDSLQAKSPCIYYKPFGGALRQVYFLMGHRVRWFFGLTREFGLILMRWVFRHLIRGNLFVHGVKWFQEEL